MGCRGAHQASMDQNPLIQFSTQLYKWREKRLNQMLASIEFSRTRRSWLLQPVENGDKCSLMHAENSSVFTVTGICFLAALSALTSALTQRCLFELSWAKHTASFWVSAGENTQGLSSLGFLRDHPLCTKHSLLLL